MMSNIRHLKFCLGTLTIEELPQRNLFSMTRQASTTVKADAIKKLTMASHSLKAVGILNLFVGGVVAVVASQADAIVFSFFLIAVGLLYIYLSVTIKHRSKIALTVATVLTGLNILLGLWTVSLEGLLISSLIMTQLVPCIAAIQAFE